MITPWRPPPHCLASSSHLLLDLNLLEPIPAAALSASPHLPIPPPPPPPPPLSPQAAESTPTSAPWPLAPLASGFAPETAGPAGGEASQRGPCSAQRPTTASSRTHTLPALALPPHRSLDAFFSRRPFFFLYITFLHLGSSIRWTPSPSPTPSPPIPPPTSPTSTPPPPSPPGPGGAPRTLAAHVRPRMAPCNRPGSRLVSSAHAPVGPSSATPTLTSAVHGLGHGYPALDRRR